MKHSQMFALCLLGSALAMPTGAMAQTQRNEGRVIEQVEVTAQKITEDVQDVPISISVVSAQDIKNINAFDFKEVEQITPGVVFGGGAGLQSAAISIRGVGPEFFALGTPPNVAIFVDQVAQSQIGAVFSTMVDIERVELLRGPQGTLYGRNAPGGAFNINTKKPDFDGVSGYVEGSYSAYGDLDLATQDLRGAVNIPVIKDTLAWRLAGVYSDSDGFITMENQDADNDTTGGKDNKALRSKMLWQPAEQVDLLWTVNYQDLEQNPGVFNYDGLVPGTGGTNPEPAIYTSFDKREGWGARQSIVTGDIRDSSVHLTWDADIFQVDAIAFYQDFDTFSDEDREPYPGGVSKFQIDVASDITTLELRLSNNGERFDYIAGLYYFDINAETTSVILQQGVDVDVGATQDAEGYAAFTNVNIHLAPQWDLSLGLRYDDVKDIVNASTTFTGITAALDNETLEFDHWSWSVKLRNYVTEDITAYLAIDHAYKQGGFNALVAGVAALNDSFNLPIPPAVALAADRTLTYGQETSDAVELGVKGKFLNDRLSLSTNIFYQRYEDHQVAQTNRGVQALGGIFGSFFIAAIDNAEEVQTVGIEADLVYLIGQNWDVTLRAAYSSATVEDWSTRFCPNGENTSPDQLYCPREGGEELSNKPKLNTNTQLGYTRQLQGNWALYSRATWTWQSAPAGNIITNNFSESKSLLGFSVGVSEPNLGLDIRGWVKNLTDEQRNIDPGSQPNGDPDLPPAFQGSFTPGRELGVTVRYDF